MWTWMESVGGYGHYKCHISEFLQMEACLGRLDVSCLSYSTEHLSRPLSPNRSFC